MQAYGITNFVFVLHPALDDDFLDGTVFTVEHKGSHIYSWTFNGTDILPSQTTPDTEPNYEVYDLHFRNEFLVAVEDNLDIGTRVYMCVDLLAYLRVHSCQHDAVDKERLARATYELAMPGEPLDDNRP